jgi:hypothetical protein
MYARVMSAHVDVNRLDELANVVRGGILPSAEEQAGFKGMLGLIDPTTGKGLLISLWETAADLEATETSGYLRSEVAKATPFLRSATYRETYEVIVQSTKDCA